MLLCSHQRQLYCLRSDLNINQLENLCIEIRKLNRDESLFSLQLCIDLIVPHAVKIFTYFELLIGMLDAGNLEYYLMGDMNCNLASSQLDNNANLLT